MVIALLCTLQEIAALKNKLRGAFGDSTDFARDITQQLEAKLGRNIDDLRDRIEQEVAQHKKEMEDTYRDRVRCTMLLECIVRSSVLACSGWGK